MNNKILFVLLVAFIFTTSVSADTCPVNEYKNRLSKIGFKDVSSVDLAATELIKFAKNKNDKCREKLIHEFRIYYYEALESYDNKNIGEGDKLSDSERRKIELSISKVGWTLKETEGSYYIGESGRWFARRFNSILTDAYRNYFRIRTKEIREGFSEDAGLLISWEQLRERIATWEQFLKNHPDFEENPGIQDYLNLYIRTFLGGLANSRIQDDNTNKLYPEVRASYEKYIRENRSSTYYSIVRDYYEMLKKNNFIVQGDINKYLKKKGYETMLGKQPPTY